MPLRDLLKKKDKIESDPAQVAEQHLPHASEFTFMRTDTHTEERIAPPAFDSDQSPSPAPRDNPFEQPSTTPQTPPKRFSRFRKGSSPGSTDGSSPEKHPKEHKRLSQRLHLGSKNRSASTSSSNLPADLPTIDDTYTDDGDQQEKEARWEERATRLASKSPNRAAAPPTGEVAKLTLGDAGDVANAGEPQRSRSVSDAAGDTNIQEAIRLHEAGQLEEATDMFHRLAESGNVLSQVLYGLSLRHGWGCTANPERAVTYLSAAASNSAEIESQALQAGMKKGGAAKGELVLAIFELANCFRHGWGVQVDKVAARHYYETAANLGDTDAMNEAAWCYLEGFGGKKDKFKAAQLLRLAEKNGSKTLGNTWIWKEKYNPK